jgi:hypothetical protein
VTDPLPLWMILDALGLVLCAAAFAVMFRHGARARRRALWLLLADTALLCAASVTARLWLQLGANLAMATWLAWLLWRGRRRGKRAPRAYGAKSRALLAALVARAREAARPRPVPRLRPDGAW